MRKFLIGIHWWFEKRIAPGLRSSQQSYAEVLISLLNPSRHWLDLGCGHQFFPDWMPDEQQRVRLRMGPTVGVDLDWEGLRKHPHIRDKVLANLNWAPFRDESFDLVSANMVAEHLSDPDQVLQELRRILRPRGIFLFHTPNSRGLIIRIASLVPDTPKKWIIELLQERKAEDVFPTYYRMNTAEQVLDLARRNGFRVREVRLLNTSATFAMIPLLGILELLYMRMLDWKPLRRYRTNLIVQLERI